MPPASRDPAAEAEALGALIEEHAGALAAGRLGQRFRLGPASFRLHATGRNTIYRVSGVFEWFLKLPRKADPAALLRERFGADTIVRALNQLPEYCGAAVIRVSDSPGYVLASAIAGKPLNRIVFRQSWMPGRAAGEYLEGCFANLGMLLARLHAESAVTSDLPDATTRPFETLRTMLGRVEQSDRTIEGIRAWAASRTGSDAGESFVHGNFRLNNVIMVGTRAGFIDLENCGRGSSSQDVSRPVAELLLARCLWVFPRQRATRLLAAFLRSYGRHHLYDARRTWDFVGARIARYYLETRGRSVFSATVGGLPLRTARLNELTGALMNGELERLLPDSDLLPSGASGIDRAAALHRPT